MNKDIQVTMKKFEDLQIGDRLVGHLPDLVVLPITLPDVKSDGSFREIVECPDHIYMEAALHVKVVPNTSPRWTLLCLKMEPNVTDEDLKQNFHHRGSVWITPGGIAEFNWQRVWFYYPEWKDRHFTVLA